MTLFTSQTGELSPTAWFEWLQMWTLPCPVLKLQLLVVVGSLDIDCCVLREDYVNEMKWFNWRKLKEQAFVIESFLSSSPTVILTHIFLNKTKVIKFFSSCCLFLCWFGSLSTIHTSLGVAEQSHCTHQHALSAGLKHIYWKLHISTHKRYKVFSHASDTIIEIIDFNMKLIRIYNFWGIMKDDELQHKHEDNTNLFIAEFNTIQ